MVECASGGREAAGSSPVIPTTILQGFQETESLCFFKLNQGIHLSKYQFSFHDIIPTFEFVLIYPIDLSIFIVYLLAMLGVGFYFMRKNKNLDDYYVGGRV